ncbi:MAG: PQQ-binding-like beta-propeller repeat protein [Armatimonadetes bacterium]|nr:PQQ-binding-like beta-propeller repeat protein [Armatimonadota bacterium]
MSRDSQREVGPGEPESAWYQAARRTAAVAAVFCIIVFVLLMANGAASRMADPLHPARIQALLIELNKNSTDERLKQEIRRLDAQVRRDYFRSQAFATQGLYLLLAGVAVYLLALEIVKHSRKGLPIPRPDAGRDAWLAAAMSRRAVIALGLVLGGVLATLVVLSRHDTAAEYAKAARKWGSGLAAGVPSLSTGPAPAPGQPPPGSVALPPLALGPTAPATPSGGTLSPPEMGAAPAPPAAVPALPAVGAGSAGNAVPEVNPDAVPPGTPVPIMVAHPKEWEQNWPGFRGPGGVGIAATSDAPTRWDGAQGEGILWQASVPLPGWNSPVVWGDRVFLSGADQHRREVYCFDAHRGTLLWRKTVPSPPDMGEINVADDTGYAPSTMVADGRRACAMFVNGDVACFDFAGKLLWLRRLGVPDNSYGHASSLAMYGNGVIIQFDQGSSAEDGKSALLALDAATGKTVWQVKRPVPNSWSTPIIIRAGNREQIITCANPWVIAYDPRSGSELWRAECLGGEVAPSPTFGSGYVLACNLGASLTAIRPDGTGDVTRTAVAWSSSENLPDIVSPLCNGELIFLTTSEGMVTCLEARMGKKVWEHSFETPVRASPTLVGNRVYLMDTKGTMHIFEAGRAFKEMGTAALGEEAHASPAFVHGRIYIRGRQHLYCVGSR